MEQYLEGTLVTLRFTDDKYLLGKIVQIEPLTLHDILHLVIYDVLLDGGPAGYDEQGEYRERTHTLPDLTSQPLAIDVIALTSDAFDDSEPQIVGFEEVSEEDLNGYVVWVARRRERAERRGMIRYDNDEEFVDDVDDDLDDDQNMAAGEFVEDNGLHPEDVVEQVEGADVEAGEPAVEIDSDEGGDVIEDEERSQVLPPLTITPRTWHDTVFDVKISQVLVDLADIFRDDAFSSTNLGNAVIERTTANPGELDSLIGRLVNDGDYAAGQELIQYGDPAADALNARLQTTTAKQGVEDILQILSEMGSDRAYGHIASFYAERADRLGTDPIAKSAARAYLYVVMLTGGTPEPLNAHLDLIDGMNDPELAEDVAAARRAIDAAEAGVTGE